MATVESMSHWQGVTDRTPRMTHGDPRGILDGCDCANGQVLVTAGPMFYSGERFPDQDTIPAKSNPCEDGWAVNITVEYARCRPVVDGKGKDPSDAVVFAHAEQLYRDGMAIWQALRCAQPKWNAPQLDGSPIPGRAVVKGWGPILRDLGPCSGFTYELTGKVKSCEDCP